MMCAGLLAAAARAARGGAAAPEGAGGGGEGAGGARGRGAALRRVTQHGRRSCAGARWAGRMSSMAADLRLALDVDHFARCAGLEGPLDPWQRRVLEGDERKILLNCSRQSGKSTMAAFAGVPDGDLRAGQPGAVREPVAAPDRASCSGRCWLPTTRSRASRGCTPRARCGWSWRTAAGWSACLGASRRRGVTARRTWWCWTRRAGSRTR